MEINSTNNYDNRMHDFETLIAKRNQSITDAAVDENEAVIGDFNTEKAYIVDIEDFLNFEEIYKIMEDARNGVFAVEVKDEKSKHIFVPGLGRIGYETCVNNSSAYHNDYGHDFFNKDNSFLYEFSSMIAADRFNPNTNKYSGDHYMEGREYRENFYLETYNYADRALEFFGGYSTERLEGYYEATGKYVGLIKVSSHSTKKEIRNVADQLREAIIEWGENIKNGKGSISDVKTKINIHDFELTLGDLISIQTNMKRITDPLDINIGYVNYARLGLSTAAVKKYTSEQLSPELGNKLVSLYEKRIRNAFKIVNREMSRWGSKPLDTSSGQNYYVQSSNNIDDNTFNAVVYRRFANQDVSSNTAFVNSVNSTLRWMEKEYGKWCDWAGLRKAVKNQQINGMYEKIISYYNMVYR